VIEAMAAGLPVVATEVGGVTELLAGGARGWPAEASTADAIGAAMTRLTEASAASRRARAEAGRAYVSAEHAPTRVFDAWCSVLFPDGATDGVTS
jgi:glycosyltransferase involved in cell wall biosynthesis